MDILFHHFISNSLMILYLEVCELTLFPVISTLLFKSFPSYTYETRKKKNCDVVPQLLKNKYGVMKDL